ncbi:PaaI family thioesterase [Mycolicibacter kumamotonensis]|uniref:PaaI family thioesterase n=1 Tax=Mycolicibacter kumamotonensis TaxID=354243 RepID=A0A7K3LCJ8_9MYCO|nr:PaaI family thioesterase [Mycolicibacter kumamotonensis]NDJ90091.1 PaaI family thioesterase [Mycolicibacter kumamotonensis]
MSKPEQTQQTQETPEARWKRQAQHYESGVPFNRQCGVRVLRWDDEQVVMTLAHAEWLCHSGNGFHGGVVASLADTCGTAASLAASGAQGFIATVSMNINYLSAATSDLTATGVCIKPGRRIQVSQVHVRDATDRLVAEAIITNAKPL